MSYARRVDENQRAIVRALRQIPGCRVYVSSSVGAGFPDLTVFFRGMVYFIEIKIVGKRRRLTPAQGDFHAEAFAGGYRIPVVETPEEAVAVVTHPVHTRPAYHRTEEPCSTQPTN